MESEVSWKNKASIAQGWCERNRTRTGTGVEPYELWWLCEGENTPNDNVINFHCLRYLFRRVYPIRERQPFKNVAVKEEAGKQGLYICFDESFRSDPKHDSVRLKWKLQAWSVFEEGRSLLLLCSLKLKLKICTSANGQTLNRPAKQGYRVAQQLLLVSGRVHRHFKGGKKSYPRTVGDAGSTGGTNSPLQTIGCVDERLYGTRERVNGALC